MSRLGEPVPHSSGASRYASPLQQVAKGEKRRDAEPKKLKSFHFVAAVRHRIVEMKLLLGRVTGQSISESEIVSRLVLATSDEDVQKLFVGEDS